MTPQDETRRAADVVLKVAETEARASKRWEEWTAFCTQVGASLVPLSTSDSLKVRYCTYTDDGVAGMDGLSYTLLHRQEHGTYNLPTSMSRREALALIVAALTKRPVEADAGAQYVAALEPAEFGPGADVKAVNVGPSSRALR